MTCRNKILPTNSLKRPGNKNVSGKSRNVTGRCIKITDKNSFTFASFCSYRKFQLKVHAPCWNQGIVDAGQTKRFSSGSRKGRKMWEPGPLISFKVTAVILRDPRQRFGSTNPVLTTSMTMKGEPFILDYLNRKIPVFTSPRS